MNNPFTRPSPFRLERNNFLQSQVRPFAPPTNPYPEQSSHHISSTLTGGTHSWDSKPMGYVAAQRGAYDRPSIGGYEKIQKGYEPYGKDYSQDTGKEYAKEYSTSNLNNIGYQGKNPFTRASLLPSKYQNTALGSLQNGPYLPSSHEIGKYEAVSGKNNYGYESAPRNYEAALNKNLYDYEPIANKNTYNSKNYESLGSNNYDRSDTASVATYINRVTDLDDAKSRTNSSYPKNSPFMRPSPFVTGNNYVETSRSNSSRKLYEGDLGYEQTPAAKNPNGFKDYSHLQYRPNNGYEGDYRPLDVSKGLDKFRYQIEATGRESSQGYDSKSEYDKDRALPVSYSQKHIGIGNLESEKPGFSIPMYGYENKKKYSHQKDNGDYYAYQRLNNGKKKYENMENEEVEFKGKDNINLYSNQDYNYRAGNKEETYKRMGQSNFNPDQKGLHRQPTYSKYPQVVKEPVKFFTKQESDEESNSAEFNFNQHREGEHKLYKGGNPQDQYKRPYVSERRGEFEDIDLRELDIQEGRGNKSIVKFDDEEESEEERPPRKINPYRDEQNSIRQKYSNAGSLYDKQKVQQNYNRSSRNNGNYRKQEPVKGGQQYYNGRWEHQIGRQEYKEYQSGREEYQRRRQEPNPNKGRQETNPYKGRQEINPNKGRQENDRKNVPRRDVNEMGEHPRVIELQGRAFHLVQTCP